MEAIIIWLIVVGFAVYNSTKKKNAKSKSQYSQKDQQPQNYRKPQNTQRSQGTPPYGGGNINPAQMQAEMARKQQEMKARLEQKYRSGEAETKPRPVQQPPRQNMNPAFRQQPEPVQQPMQPKPVQQKNIMDRAMANVKENEVDELEKSGELMAQVNDLMIMGYQAKLSFSRDFVGEGLDMLNSYELPNGMEQQN